MTGFPLILAIETSAPCLSVALLRGEDVVSERRFDAATRGGSALHPGVAEMLAAAGAAPLAMVAAGIGPGSYTGTRIGLVFAKTFAFARNIPVVGVCALEAVAMRVMAAGRVATLMAANPGRVYSAIYACAEGDAPRVERPPELVARADIDRVIGDARVLEMPPEQSWASDVGRVAARRVRLGEAPGDPDGIAPLYLQPPAPERA